jgi:hypothetical protein
MYRVPRTSLTLPAVVGRRLNEGLGPSATVRRAAHLTWLCFCGLCKTKPSCSCRDEKASEYRCGQFDSCLAQPPAWFERFGLEIGVYLCSGRPAEHAWRMTEFQ